MAVVETTTVYRGLKAFSNARNHPRSLILGLVWRRSIVQAVAVMCGGFWPKIGSRVIRPTEIPLQAVAPTVATVMTD